VGKVLVIGIDGLDPKLLEKLERELPNLKGLRGKGDMIRCNSIYPYDSVPIWSSIYTGVTPAKHGILKVNNNDLFRQSFRNENNLIGRTFWDYASDAGKKVCIINPFIAYPPWKVNGIMVSGPVDPAMGQPLSKPEEIAIDYQLPPMGGIHQHYPAKKDLDQFIKRSEEMTKAEAEFSLSLLRDSEWDLAFICFTALDGIEHFFWRYQDVADPTYIPGNKYESAIKEFYILMDQIVGEFAKLSYDTLIVLSDHGHGMRNTRLVNINDVLYNINLINVNNGAKSQDITLKILNSAKKRLLNLTSYLNLDDKVLRCAQRFPKLTKRIQKSDYCINKQECIAFTSDLAGMNPCGGVELVSSNTPDGDREKICLRIITQLLNLEDPNTGQKIVKWACMREQLYDGPFLSTFPDILFELEGSYGTNWNINAGLIEDNYAHKIISGGHKSEAVFLIVGEGRGSIRSEITSVDVAPIILGTLGVKPPAHFDGFALDNDTCLD